MSIMRGAAGWLMASLALAFAVPMQAWAQDGAAGAVRAAPATAQAPEGGRGAAQSGVASAEGDGRGDVLPAPAAPKPKPETVFVRLETSAGTILLELEKGRAPITTANFLRYVDAKKLDGETFYRAFRMSDDFGLIQAGITSDARKLLPPIKLEPTSQTGLSHQTGTISMARSTPNSARSDFFITIGDMSGLDAQPDKPGDNLGFAAFGHVAGGMDVVRAIMLMPVSPTLGEKEGMKGQMLDDPVRIMSARRVPAP